MIRFLMPLLAAAPSPYRVAAADDHAPKHGGVVLETKAGDLELVAKPDMIRVHVSDHGKPMKLTSGTGKVTVFNGARRPKLRSPSSATSSRPRATSRSRRERRCSRKSA